MGLSDSSFNSNRNFFLFYHIARYHVIRHVVLNYVERVTIVFLISIHTGMLIAIAMKMKMKGFKIIKPIVIVSICFFLGGAGGGAISEGSQERVYRTISEGSEIYNLCVNSFGFGQSLPLQRLQCCW